MCNYDICNMCAPSVLRDNNLHNIWSVFLALSVPLPPPPLHTCCPSSTTFDLCVIVSESKIQTWSCLASFPGPARSLLSVRNSRRGSWLVHHVMCAAGRVFTSADNVCCVAEYMYKGVRSTVVNFRWGVRGAEPLVRPRNPPWPGLVWPMYLNIYM